MIWTACAQGGRSSIGEVVIPRSQQEFPIGGHQPFDQSQFLGAVAATIRKAHRVELKLSGIGVTFDMDVGRFMPIGGVEEEPIGAMAKDCRHGVSLKQVTS